MGYSTDENPSAGFPLLKSFLDRKKENEVCRRRKELLAQKHSLKNNRADGNEAEKHAFEAAWYDHQLEWIASVHRICGESIAWDQIAATMPPYPRGEKGPREKLAEASCLEYKPTRMQKLLKQDDAIRRELEERLEEAKEQDRQEYTRWKNVTDFAHSILEGNRTAYLQVLEEIAPLADLQMMGSGLEYTVVDALTVEVEMDVNSGQMIPHESKQLSGDGMFTANPLRMEERYELERQYVCGSVLRVARELCAVLPVDTVLVHAKDTKFNRETGQEEYVTVLSIRFERPLLSKLDLEKAICPQLKAYFHHHVKFDAAWGFLPVEQLGRL
ncbi:hypothetical protein G8C92_16400 [Paenibacillus donghaensis]|uniref:hypothetical protein n=1 Tax=Paenibacillus donghaensis TaxID=414771 RepID=UPI001883923F|nr:hypothetical protein [Paenibacillus donghaensis]MBE9915601.1 hypothetical protein [Paenibacillus donghaensis]